MLDEIEPFEVFGENLEIIDWFMRMNNRWVYSPMGERMRLDDQAITAQLIAREIKKKQRIQILDGLLIMESAALEEMNKHG